MHDSCARLYQAAKELTGTQGQSAVARLLGETPQTVKNWEKRGVSADGAIAAQKLMGCRASWIRDGEGLMTHQAPTLTDAASAAPTLADALEALGIALAVDMPPDVRDDLADALAKLARRGGAARDQAQVLQLLQAGAAGGAEPVKRQRAA
jgi:hypothetical protein